MIDTLSWTRPSSTADADPPVVATAYERAGAAATRAGVTLRTADSLDDVRRATVLFDATWTEPNGAGPVLPGLAWAMVHAGNHLGIAERDGDVVGATLGFRAADSSGPYLHSHLAAVAPAARTAHVGYALKLQQRAWALEHDLPRLAWTFDPLVARNGYFNITKLGAIGIGYQANFYGTMADPMNAGAASDRCLIEWQLAGRRATDAAEGNPSPIDISALRATNTPVVLAIAPDGTPARPRNGDEVRAHSSDLLVRIPSDIVALRVHDAPLAAEWRTALREVLHRAFADGYQLTGADRGNWYLLHRNADRA